MKKISCEHPGCQSNALSLSKFCWQHTQDKKNYVEKISEHVVQGKSLSGFNLEKTDLSCIYLEKADLFST